MSHYFKMPDSVNSPYTPRQQTAFTSLLVGVFLNSSLLSKKSLPGITETAVASYYGQPFLDSLDYFSGQSTLIQINILHKLQRYISLLNFFSNFKN